MHRDYYFNDILSHFYFFLHYMNIYMPRRPSVLESKLGFTALQQFTFYHLICEIIFYFLFLKYFIENFCYIFLVRVL